jgi:hypothetical protein
MGHIFGLIEHMRELCAGGAKVPLNGYHLDPLSTSNAFALNSIKILMSLMIVYITPSEFSKGVIDVLSPASEKCNCLRKIRLHRAVGDIPGKCH